MNGATSTVLQLPSIWIAANESLYINTSIRARPH